MTVTFRVATEEDAFTFYGKRPDRTLRGIVAVKDGVVIGIGGVHHAQGAMFAFTEMKPEMRKHRKARAEACRLIIALAQEVEGPVFAVANADEPTSGYLLIKLGFVPTGQFCEYGEILRLRKE